MPIPVSRTSIHTCAPRTRASTTTPPCAVYFSALSTKLDSNRCSRCASLRTHSGLARSRSCNSRSEARAENT